MVEFRVLLSSSSMEYEWAQTLFFLRELKTTPSNSLHNDFSTKTENWEKERNFINYVVIANSFLR